MVTIRQAALPDMPRMIVLLQVLFSLETDFTFNVEKQAQGLEFMLNDQRSLVLVAEMDGRVVGMGTGQRVISTAEGGPSILVEDMVVDEAWRGRGIGRRLMDHLATWAKTQSATRLQLLADHTNTPAFKFYQRLGFEQTRMMCLRRIEPKG